MTASQKLKKTMIVRLAANIDPTEDEVYDNDLDTPEGVERAWERFNEKDDLHDIISEFRHGQFKTGLDCEWSRHYESEAVAAKMFDGSYVGWVRWFGGGKHGEPEAIEWIEDAYEVDCVVEMKPVHTFTKKEI